MYNTVMHTVKETLLQLTQILCYLFKCVIRSYVIS